MKLQKSDILKRGAEIKAFKLNWWDQSVRKAIATTLQLQKQTLELNNLLPETLETYINF